MQKLKEIFKMKKYIPISLILFRLTLAPIILVLSCAQNNAKQQEDLRNKNNKALFEHNPNGLKLKFIYGTRAILHDSKGNYWFGSNQEGVCLFDGKSLTYFTTENGLLGNQIRAIKEDTVGKIWFETNKGICHYDGKNMVKNNSSSSFLNPSNPVTLLNVNDLWFYSCEKATVLQYDGKQFNQLDLPNNGKKDWSNDVNAFSKGKNKMLWIASYAAVYGFDGKNFKIIDDKSLGFNQQTGLLHIRSILEDSKGRLWIGNNGIGVLVNEGNSFINFSEKMGLVALNSTRSGAHSPINTMEHIFAIAEDHAGNIWFGDRDNGAWKYDGKTMKNYTIGQSLSSQQIWSIYQDKNGDLLFAMAEGGVYRFINEQFERVF